MKAEYTFNFGVVQNLAHRQIWRTCSSVHALCTHCINILWYCNVRVRNYMNVVP